MSSLTPSLGKLLLFWFHKGHQHLTHKKQIPGYFVCLRTTRWANSRRRKVKFRQKEEPMTEHWLNLLFFHRIEELQKMTKMSPFSGWFVYALNPYKEMHCDKGERSESPTSKPYDAPQLSLHNRVWVASFLTNNNQFLSFGPIDFSQNAALLWDQLFSIFDLTLYFRPKTRVSWTSIWFGRKFIR